MNANQSTQQTLGIDLGGSTLRAGVVSRHEVLQEWRRPAAFSTQADDATAVEFLFSELTGVIEQARDAFPGIAHVGIGMAGFVDARTGRVVGSPNLPGIHDLDVAGRLSRACGLPVSVENDALVAAWGEYCLQPPAAGGLVYIGLGTGIGGGVILDGRPWRGVNGLAMEIGHLIVEPGGRPCGCGNRGCVERYASASGVILSYAESSQAESDLPTDARAIADLARNGHYIALEAFQRAGTELGTVVAHLAKVLDIEQFVIGGGMSRSWALMSSAFDRQLQADLIDVLRERLNVRVSTAADQSGMIGAAGLVLLSNRSLT